MPRKLLYVLLLVFAITPSLGFYTDGSFVLLTILVACVVYTLFRSDAKEGTNTRASRQSVPLFCLALIISGIPYYGGLYQLSATLAVGMAALGIVAVVLIFARHPANRLFIFLLIVYGSLASWTIVSSPNPTVDVFVLLREAPLNFLRGIHPYSATYRQVYPGIAPPVFTYLPMSFLLSIPSVLLFGDPRYLIVFAMIVLAVYLYRNTRSNEKLYLIAVLLFLPRNFFLLEHMYIEPLIAITLFLSVQLWQKRRVALAAFLFSLSLTYKLDTLIIIPAVFPMLQSLLSHARARILFALPVLLVLVFALTSPTDFIRHVFFTNAAMGLTPSPAASGIPVDKSLSVPVWLVRHFGGTLVSPAAFILQGIALLTIALIIVRPIKMLTKIWMTFLLAHYVIAQSFFNHYYFVVFMMLLDCIDDLIISKKSSAYERS